MPAAAARFGHRDRIEAVLGHQRGEGLEDTSLDLLAVLIPG
jgi:hypothetical protein